MKSHDNLKMYTLRHFLFYAGVTVVLGIMLGIASNTMEWSYGLKFAAAATTGLTICGIAMREELFGPVRPSNPSRRRSHRA
jgi:hypothetical protein